MLREPVTGVIDAKMGTMGGKTGRYEKRLADLEGLYEDAAAHARATAELQNPLVYAVEDFRPGDHAGDLIYGITRMSPGLIGEEFYLTRGHIHARADRPEIYYGQQGQGLMQLESPDGETRIVEIGPQTICYVPPYWIHRSVNVGDEDLVMVFAYPSDSGQDYGIIEAANGMRHRVKSDGKGGWRLAENRDYRPRSAAVVETLMKRCA